ncbi:MAG: aldehyde dehydrogenase family protein [Bacteroidales bacterium]|nr:aldehyde dehydrogenase family protein [Bacteroidales bacterium]MCF8403170.1 aldehyde dehydrogenase family protein [Bacteroidales bacterium]
MEFKIYCAGKFLISDKKLNITNPYSGEFFAHTWLGNKDILERAILAALEAEPLLKSYPVYKKYAALKYIAHQLEIHTDDFAEILCLESGKPIRYAKGEVNRAIQTFTIAAEESKRIPGEHLSLDWTAAGENKEGWVKHFPIGLVAGISPFNFPLNLAVHKIAPAIAAGCPIILKPSSSTPLSTLKLAEIIHQSGLPEGSVSIIPMDRPTGNLLVTDDRVKLLSFTGSPAVGWEMKKNAGKKKLVLELGGNAGVIVSESADIDQAVNRCLLGGFAYSGQVCIHTQRIYVQTSVYQAFLDKFLPLVNQLNSGDPLDEKTEISSMIDEENALRVEKWVKEAKDDGAKILCGGKRSGSTYTPTVLNQTKAQMKVCSQEVFGPVVTLEPYNTFEEAIELVNDSRYGLQAGIFTNSINEMNLAFHQLNVGGVIINDVPTFRVDHMPYGGVKDSGTGREGVKYTMMHMMETKLLVKNKF